VVTFLLHRVEYAHLAKW